jgi:hypothetical protein
MISMTYDPRRETFRFAKRKIGFAFAPFTLIEARSATLRSASSLSALRRAGRPEVADKSCAKKQLSH